MSNVKLMPQRLFLITYDNGYSTQTVKVPVELYENEEAFRKYITFFKCLQCNFESNFDVVKKEIQN